MTHNPNDLANDQDDEQDYQPDINPATGLPMVDDAWVDVGGSPYGTDIHQPPWVPPPTSFDNW